MDDFNPSAGYQYNTSYGYPEVPRRNSPYPPSNSGQYPNPDSGQYPPPSSPQYPHPSSGYFSVGHYPPPNAPAYPPHHHHSYFAPSPGYPHPPPPQSGAPYAYPPTPPLPPPPHNANPPTEYYCTPPPSASPPHYPHPDSSAPSYLCQSYQAQSVPYSTSQLSPPTIPASQPASPARLSLQHYHSFHSGSLNHYQHASPLTPPDSESSVLSRPNSFSSHHQYESFPVHLGSNANHELGHDNAATYHPVYPPIDDLLNNLHISNNQPSAPASPPAPAGLSLSSSSPKYQSLSGRFDAQGSQYGYIDNYKYQSQGDSSPHPSSPGPAFGHSSSFVTDRPQGQNLQIVPFSDPKGSLKVLPLHGNLDIWVYEAKNLPNMDMFHKTFGDMFRLPGNMSSKIEGSHKITSDPYVSISITTAVIGRTYVISNSENPVWMQHFYVPVAHYAAEVHFVVKDSDVVGSQLIGVVTIPVEHLYGGGKIEGSFPILNSTGKPCKPGAVLSLSIQYTPIERLNIYYNGVGAGPDYYGVPGTYFPLRKGGKVTLYQDAHVPDGSLPNIKLEYGFAYAHGKCWQDIFDAVRQARRLIYITGWSVWHKVRLVRDANPKSGFTLGELLKSKSQEGVRVLLLVWDDPTSRSILGYKTDGIMQTHDEETRRFFKHSSVQVLLCPRIAGKRHSWVKQREVGTIYTHHQKTVIVDADAGNNKRRIIAFVGGLDLCDGRYDTPEHPILRTLQTVHADDYHNPTYTGNVAGCPREPWHDLHCKIDGPAAYDILINFEERWRKASRIGLKKFKSSEDSLLKIERMPEILGVSDMPSLGDDDPQSWHVQVFRSIDSNSVKGFPKEPKDAMHKNLMCGKNVLIDMSIHTAYVKAIRAAQHFIYIENQYFIGSSFNWNSYRDLGANNLIPMEIALKIASKIRAHERFAAYIVLPMWPEGSPTGAATQRILFWQHKTMQMMYETIYKALLEVGLEDAYSPQDYLNFFCLGNREAINMNDNTNAEGPAENTPQALSRKYRRFMIYVHSKGMIVDDEYVILGSANINQRSLEGSRDTEIAMGAYQPHHTWGRKQSGPRGQIYGYRMSLWAEHLGIVEETFTQPETVECVRKVRTMAEMNWNQFAANYVTEMRGHLMTYPVEVDRKGKVRPIPGQEHFPDVGGSIVGSFLAIQENLTI